MNEQPAHNLKHRASTLAEIKRYVYEHREHFGFFPNALRLLPQEWANIMNDGGMIHADYFQRQAQRKEPLLYGMAIIIDRDLEPVEL